MGSSEHYLSEYASEHGAIGLGETGEQLLLGTFINNIESFDLQDLVIALPLDSQSAATLVSEANIRPNLIHIDAGHSYFSVLHDLMSWFSILAPGGTMVCDDYTTWSSVRQAIETFKSFTEVINFQTSKNKCSFEKPIVRTMPLAGTPVEKVDVSIQYNDYVLQALNSENLLLRERIEGHEKKYLALQNSLSWQITKPLRKIKKLFT